MKKLRILLALSTALLPLGSPAAPISLPPPSLPLLQVNGGKGFSPTQFTHLFAAIAKIKACNLGTAQPGTTCSSFANPIAMFVGDSTFAAVAINGTSTQPRIDEDLAYLFSANGVPSNASCFFGNGPYSVTTISRAAYDTRLAGVANSGTGWNIAAHGAAPSTGTVGGGIFHGYQAGNNLVFTPSAETPIPGGTPLISGFNVYYDTATTNGSMTLTATGGTAASVNENAAAAAHVVYVPASATSTTNALTATWVSGNDYIEGFEAVNNTATTKTLDWCNAGWAGATSSNVLPGGSAVFNTLQEINFVHPALVILEGGVINDWLQSVPTSTTQANLTSFITNDQTNGIDTLLVTGTPDATNNAIGGYQDAATKMMVALGQTYGVPVLDINTLLGGAPNGYTQNSANGLMYDANHGNSSMNFLQAELMYNALNE